MAGGAFTFFNIAKPKLINGTLDLDSNTIKAALCTVTQSLTATFAGSSTDARYADLTNELGTANGYTAGGVTLSGLSVTQSGGTVTWTATSPAWTLTGTITAYYIVLYASSVTNSPLIGFALLDSTPASVSPIAGTFTVAFNGSGIATMA